MSESLAKERGFRLPSNEEVVEYLGLGALFEGEDQWVATKSTMKDKTKDYINVGDVDDKTGVSYRAEYKEWPDWADKASADNMS